VTRDIVLSEQIDPDGWHRIHVDTTGHDRCYRWRLERVTGRVYRI
jgi:hypothetical protein